MAASGAPVLGTHNGLGHLKVHQLCTGLPRCRQKSSGGSGESRSESDMEIGMSVLRGQMFKRMLTGLGPSLLPSEVWMG